MSGRLRYTLGLASLLGGLLGVVLAGALLVRTGQVSMSSAFVLVCALGLFAFGSYAGWATIKEIPGWQSCMLVFWALQTPLVATPSFTYLSSAALCAWVYVTSEPQIGANLYVGSQLQLNAGTPGPVGPHVAVGVNLAALVVVVLVLRDIRRHVA